MDINVAVAILINDDSEFLVSDRINRQEFREFLEFPGGKIENCESPAEALARELFEELELSVDEKNLLQFLAYEANYGIKIYKIYSFILRINKDKVTPREGQKIKWLNLEELNKSKILPGNKPIIEELNKFFREEEIPAQ